MMDIDEKKLEDRLSKVIYYASSQDAEISRLLVEYHRLDCPLQVRVIQHRRLAAPAAPAGCAAFGIHDGLTAWAGAAVPVPPEPHLAGDPIEVLEPVALLGALRQAIVSMRDVELRAIEDQYRAYLTPEDERRIVELTVRELRLNSPTSLEVATTCCQTLVLLYRGSLNNLRRKLIDLISAVTAGTGASSPLGNTYVATVGQLISTYALSEIMEWFPERLVELASIASEARSREQQSGRSPLVREALHYIRHRYTAPVSLRDVATSLGVSRAHLARAFHQELDETVVQALNRLRLEAARELLATTDLPLKAIAADCGFGSMEHFQRLFRREVGVTPGVYQRNQTNAISG